jgi:hypothetical protein
MLDCFLCGENLLLVERADTRCRWQIDDDAVETVLKSIRESIHRLDSGQELLHPEGRERFRKKERQRCRWLFFNNRDHVI